LIIGVINNDMFSENGYSFLKFQIGTSNEGKGGRRFMPFVFTEQGVADFNQYKQSPA